MTSFKQDNPGCDCCECVDPPSCTISGSCTDDDVTLTWTVSGVGITSAEITDNRGNSWPLTVPPTSGTVTVTGGCCYRYTLTVTNDCGSSTCVWARTPGDCVCASCTYTSGDNTITQNFPAGLCIPCGCARGEGDLITAVLSGIPALMSTQRTCESGPFFCNAYPPTWSHPCWTEYSGFNVINGTYLFDLGNVNCSTCGATGCRIDPGYYIIGSATVTQYNNNTCDFGTPTPAARVFTVQFAIGFQAPGATPPSTGAPIECWTGFPNFQYKIAGTPLFESRVAPKLFWRRTAPTTSAWAEMEFNDWDNSSDLSGIGTPTDTCGLKFIAKAYGHALLSSCCQTIGTAWPTLLLTPFDEERSGFATVYANYETSVTTIGY